MAATAHLKLSSLLKMGFKKPIPILGASSFFSKFSFLTSQPE
jgi:hypothetical protein